MARWLNPFYSREVLASAHEQLVENKNMSLLQFLSNEGRHAFHQLRWVHCGDPLKYSYREAKVPAFAKSKEFADVLSSVVGVRVAVKELSCRAFMKGDYTVLSDSTPAGKGVMFILDVNEELVDEVDNVEIDRAWNESWGGYTSFLKGSEEVVRIVPRHNCLFLINQSGLRSFTKYVNNHASRPRVFLVGTLVPK